MGFLRCQMLRKLTIRDTQLVEGQLNILRFHYNFLRPHQALKFGPEIRTPAVQAGLAKRRFSFRDVFTFFFAIIRMRQLESILKWRMSFVGITSQIHT